MNLPLPIRLLFGGLNKCLLKEKGDTYFYPLKWRSDNIPCYVMLSSYNYLNQSRKNFFGSCNSMAKWGGLVTIAATERPHTQSVVCWSFNLYIKRAKCVKFNLQKLHVLDETLSCPYWFGNEKKSDP